MVTGQPFLKVLTSSPVMNTEKQNNADLDNVWMVHAEGSCFPRNQESVNQVLHEYTNNFISCKFITFPLSYYQIIIYLYLSKLFVFVIEKNENNLQRF